MGYADISIERRLANLDDKLIGISKAVKASRRDNAADAILKGITAALAARVAAQHDGPLTNIGETIGRLYPDRAPSIVRAMGNLHAFLIDKAVTNPAMTSVAGWAQELVMLQPSSSLFATLAPASAYAQLATRAASKITGDGFGPTRLVSRVTPDTVANPFIGEGQPIPSRQIGLTGPVLQPYKCAVISLFSKELAKRSTPNIEQVLRVALQEDIGLGIDSVMLGSGAASSTQPQGLLFGLTPITASTATPASEAMADDLSALSAAIWPAASVTFIMSASQAARAAATGLDIITSATVPAKTVIAIDSSDLATVSSSPFIDVTEDAAIVSADPALPVTDAAGVRGVPTLSFFQMSLVGIKVEESCGWQLRSGKVAYVEDVKW